MIRAINNLILVLDNDRSDEMDICSAAMDADADLHKLQAWIKYAGHHEDCEIEKWRLKWNSAIHTPIPDCSCGGDELRESCKAEP